MDQQFILDINQHIMNLQYDENSANSPSVGGASPRATESSGQQLRPAAGNDNHDQPGAVHNGTKQHKTSNIQVVMPDIILNGLIKISFFCYKSPQLETLYSLFFSENFLHTQG